MTKAFPGTLLEFEHWFRTEKSCRNYLERVRWPEGFVCPECRTDKAWRTSRGRFYCQACHAIVSVTAGTVFHRSKVPLRLWFRAMWWMTNPKIGINAMGLQRLLGLPSYSTAWMMLHKLRRAMVTRVADRRVLRLIRKWLRAGVSEEGNWSKTEVGTPQGAVISPLLANLYLHYVFDVWVKHWRKHQATGDMVVVRYADDIVAGFENRADAERFLSVWKARMQKFGLELHPDKTRLIEFGRHASENRKWRGEDKPETFDFLGFTHMCGRTRKTPVHR